MSIYLSRQAKEKQQIKHVHIERLHILGWQSVLTAGIFQLLNKIPFFWLNFADLYQHCGVFKGTAISHSLPLCHAPDTPWWPQGQPCLGSKILVRARYNPHFKKSHL